MVVILLTGPPSVGKEVLTQLLDAKYDYKALKVTKATPSNIWDFEKGVPITTNKEAIIKETAELINLSLKDWRSDQIIYPIYYPESVETILKKRSYFKIVSMIGPTEIRYENFKKKYKNLGEISLEQFIDMDDHLNFEVNVADCQARAEVEIKNLGDLGQLDDEIEKHELLTKKIFRPNWDNYFMKVAHVIRERGNCLARSVGAVLVWENRIISTGYNGTPSRLKNCFQGGCSECTKGAIAHVTSSDSCICFHAEESAILECGVHKAKGCILYSTVPPCRWCIKALIAADLSGVVYDESNIDETTEVNDLMLYDAGIDVKRLNMGKSSVAFRKKSANFSAF